LDTQYYEKPRRRADLGRDVLTLEDLSDKYHIQSSTPIKCHHRIRSYAKSKITHFSPLTFLTKLVPILSWLPRYEWRKDAVNDLVSGFTVAIMHIPQGMAYGMLAGVDPVVGIYTAFFPVLLYLLLGTMPHVSMGTFAVISIMVSKPVSELSGDVYTPIQVAAAVTFCVGVIQFAAGLSRLGFISILLTDTIISAFTVGASMHVLTSQIKHILGVSIARQSGPGRLVLTYVEIGKSLSTTNYVTLGISLSTLVVAVLADRVISPRLKSKCRFPLPTQLFLIVVFTTLSAYLGFGENYNVRTIDDIGQIPVGIPEPSVPLHQLVPQVILDSIAPAVVSFAIGLGLGKMFGKTHGYEVEPSQELIAQGAANIFGSFFSCIPMAGSLSRSVVQEASGCRSMLTSLTSAVLLLSVMLYLGPLFQPLPVSVLAAIILASLFGIVKKICEVRTYWSISPYEGCIWLTTFLATVFLDVDYGLVLGVLSSLCLTVLRSLAPSIVVLEQRDGVWLDKRLFSTEGGTKVIQISGPLHFMVADTIRCKLELELEPSGEVMKPERLGDVVLDLSGVSYLDRQAATILPWLHTKLRKESRSLGVVATNNHLDLVGTEVDIFPTYIDALIILGNQAHTTPSTPPTSPANTPDIV